VIKGEAPNRDRSRADPVPPRVRPCRASGHALAHARRLRRSPNRQPCRCHRPGAPRPALPVLAAGQPRPGRAGDRREVETVRSKAHPFRQIRPGPRGGRILRPGHFLGPRL